MSVPRLIGFLERASTAGKARDRTGADTELLREARRVNAEHDPGKKLGLCKHLGTVLEKK